MHALLPDEAATRAFGARLADLLTPRRRWLIALRGELGAGKTTLVRGLLRGLGHEGRVRSPTYTLIEPYRLRGRDVLHLDLYRLADPGELEYLGLSDLLTAESVALVEWPERGGGLLPAPDLVIELGFPAAAAGADPGRTVDLTASEPAGQALVEALRIRAEDPARTVSN